VFKKGKALFEQKACSLPQLLQYRTEKYTRECGLERVCFRTLRHTSATLMIVSRQDVKTASSRLGHAQTSTTKRGMSAKNPPQQPNSTKWLFGAGFGFRRKRKNLENQGFSLELLGGFDPPTSSLPKSRGRFCGVPIHTE
jgi:integrase